MAQEKSAALNSWIASAALPLWGQAGFDAQHERFEERLTFHGAALLDVPIRLMSQARQIYVFALAARRKWYGGALELVIDAYASMVRDFYRPDGSDGWVYSIYRTGEVADGRRDLYGHAFALLAIASYVQATGRSEQLALADATLTFIDNGMAALGGGFFDAVPPKDTFRRQNPHMHLFEALLALWECSGQAKYLARAGEIFGLFASRFFQPQYGVLGEYFGHDLEPVQSAALTVVEPGHHYEWIWLLRRFEAATGRAVSGFVDALYLHADTHGYDNEGLIVAELWANGSSKTSSRRTWPMTEAIKANVVEASLGRPHAIEKSTKLVSKLFEYFLMPQGGWVDRRDAYGRADVAFMPASTFYHVACAIDELSRFAFSIDAAPRANS